MRSGSIALVNAIIENWRRVRNPKCAIAGVGWGDTSPSSRATPDRQRARRARSEVGYAAATKGATGAGRRPKKPHKTGPCAPGERSIHNLERGRSGAQLQIV